MLDVENKLFSICAPKSIQNTNIFGKIKNGLLKEEEICYKLVY